MSTFTDTQPLLQPCPTPAPITAPSTASLLSYCCPTPAFLLCCHQCSSPILQAATCTSSHCPQVTKRNCRCVPQCKPSCTMQQRGKPLLTAPADSPSASYAMGSHHLHSVVHFLYAFDTLYRPHLPSDASHLNRNTHLQHDVTHAGRNQQLLAPSGQDLRSLTQSLTALCMALHSQQRPQQTFLLSQWLQMLLPCLTQQTTLQWLLQ